MHARVMQWSGFSPPRRRAPTRPPGFLSPPSLKCWPKGFREKAKQADVLPTVRVTSPRTKVVQTKMRQRLGPWDRHHSDSCALKSRRPKPARCSAALLRKKDILWAGTHTPPTVQMLRGHGPTWAPTRNAQGVRPAAHANFRQRTGASRSEAIPAASWLQARPSCRGQFRPGRGQTAPAGSEPASGGLRVDGRSALGQGAGRASDTCVPFPWGPCAYAWGPNPRELTPHLATVCVVPESLGSRHGAVVPFGIATTFLGSCRLLYGSEQIPGTHPCLFKKKPSAGKG